MAVADGIAEGLLPELRRLEPCEAEMPGIRNVNRLNRAGSRMDRGPDPEGLEDRARAIAECAGAIIEARLRRAVGRDRLDQQHAQVGLRQRKREAGTDHPAAGDRYVVAPGESAHAAAISASIASVSLGTPLLSTSQPPRVTTTSSSMRPPMFQKERGTPREPAAM